MKVSSRLSSKYSGSEYRQFPLARTKGKLVANDPRERALAYAGVGHRFIALVLDWVILIGILAVFAALAGEQESCESGTWVGFNYSVNGDESFFGLCGFPAVIYFLFGLAYYIVSEWLLMGTPGKLMAGLRVTTPEGEQVGFTAALLRNLLRVIDMIPYFIPYLVGAIIIWSSKKNQRLGDQVGKTVVVRSSSL